MDVVKLGELLLRVAEKRSYYGAIWVASLAGALALWRWPKMAPAWVELVLWLIVLAITVLALPVIGARLAQAAQDRGAGRAIGLHDEILLGCLQSWGETSIQWPTEIPQPEGLLGEGLAVIGPQRGHYGGMQHYVLTDAGKRRLKQDGIRCLRANQRDPERKAVMDALNRGREAMVQTRWL